MLVVARDLASEEMKEPTAPAVDQPVSIASRQEGGEMQPAHHRSWRRRAFEILELWHSDDRVATGVNVTIIVTILISLTGTIIETESSISQSYGLVIRVIELFAVTLFSIEYIARVWASAEQMSRWRYLVTFSAVIDLMAIAPFFLTAFIGVDLLFLRALRLLRILKMTRYFAPLGILWDVMKAEGRAFLAALIVLILLTIMAASVMYWAESEAQPDAFRSIPAAVWWSVVTLTTVGYGDVTPVTPVGRFIGTVIMVLGIGMVALPAGMLASRFSEELHKRREAFRRTVRRARSDGALSDEERSLLEDKRSQLCLSEHDAETILSDQALLEETAVCPTCQRPLDRSRATEQA